MSQNYTKSYSRINWENSPSYETPINETNLNKIDLSLDTVDNRIIELETTKTDLETAYSLVKSIDFDEDTGVFTITKLNGTTLTIDTLLEKVAINFDYDSTNQKLIIYLEDGTTKEVDLSSLITEYEFTDSDTVKFTVSTDGTVTAEVIDGSIKAEKLDPDYLAEIKVSVANAKQSEDNAETYYTLSKSYAVGDTGEREEEDVDNSKYYYELSKASADISEGALEQINTKLNLASFDLDEDGNLVYTDDTGYLFTVDDNGYLNYEVAEL